jgi:hypothetical protein
LKRDQCFRPYKNQFKPVDRLSLLWYRSIYIAADLDEFGLVVPFRFIFKRKEDRHAIIRHP